MNAALKYLLRKKEEYQKLLEQVKETEEGSSAEYSSEITRSDSNEDVKRR